MYQTNRSSEATDQVVWENAIRYVRFWALYRVRHAHQEILKTDHCRVICESLPLGIVGVLVGNARLDEIIFLISAALVHGNGVIIGLSTDQKINASDGDIIKAIFESEKGLVSVTANDGDTLLDELASEKNVVSLWYIKNRYNLSSQKRIFKNTVAVESPADMIDLAEFFEIHATKQRALWLPDMLV